jgi:hypothetical protein
MMYIFTINGFKGGERLLGTRMRMVGEADAIDISSESGDIICHPVTLCWARTDETLDPKRVPFRATSEFRSRATPDGDTRTAP